jgi:acetyl esterase/lipase
MSFASSITETAFQLRMKMVGKTEEKINSFANKKQSSEPQPYYKMLYNIETVVLNDFIYYVVKPKTVAKTSKQTKAIIYIHGGSFIMELSYFH